jgi:hypothetical protein
MKKFWLSLGLTLILTCWCGEGYYGFGTGAAFGQSYYSAPYADPLSQLLYYIAPKTSRDQYYDDRYYEQPQRYERQDRDNHPPGWDKGRKTGWGEAPMPPGQMKKHDR